MTAARATPAPAAAPLRVAALTVGALTGFAANSLLCRAALREGQIDAATFSAIRVISGAGLLLGLLQLVPRGRRTVAGGNWISAAWLFTYMIAFSLAYLSLSAGTGALILFGTVQVTMLAAALRSGERPHPLTWGGLLLALAGLVYLVSPGLSAPDPRGTVLMALAGLSWGLYTLRGRRTTDPLADTAGNFVRAAPLALLAAAIGLPHAHTTGRGVALALASGTLASGLGYAAWYAALRSLAAIRAAVLQLTVPLLAALGGVLFLAEAPSLRLGLATVLILGGVGLALAARLRGSGRGSWRQSQRPELGE